MARYLSIFAALTIFSGCCNTSINPAIGVPPRPVLIDLSQEQWNRTPLDVQDTVSHNDLALKEHVRKLEARIVLHDKEKP